MENPKPINTLNLLSEIDQKLIKVLKDLSLEDWSKQTIARKWTVKDIAVHLLDGNLRALSMLRDHYFEETTEQIDSYTNLVAYLNRLNADWVNAMKRLSPNIIIELLKVSGKEYYSFLNTLDLNENAVFSVAWAGEDISKNWFHIAREYTEKWHHQQQIRLAIGKEKELLNEKWYIPYLDTSVRGLRYHYRKIEVEENVSIKFTFRGENDKSWFLLRKNKVWNLITKLKEKPNCEVIINDEIAWRIFTKGITKEEAISNSKIIGDQYLGMKIFEMVAVMA